MTVIDRPDTDCLLGSPGAAGKVSTMDQVVASLPPGFQPKQAVNLADLYRKAKAKGVLTPFSHYPSV